MLETSPTDPMEKPTRLKVQVLVLLVLFLLVMSYAWKHYSNIEQRYLDEARQAEIDALRNGIATAQQSAESSRRALQQLQEEIGKTTAGSTSAKVETRLAAIQADVRRNQSDIASIRDALLDNPEKAVSMPLLKKDVDNLQLAEKRDVDQLRTEMGRIYEQTRWLIGLMFTLVFGLFGTVVVQFLWPRKKSESSMESAKSAAGGHAS